LPVGTPVDFTAQPSEDLEQQLIQKEGVKSVMRSVGMTGFRFFYNLSSFPNAPNRARLMVNTHAATYNQDIINWVEREVKYEMPEATLVAKPLGQGPPLPAPIMLRLQHPNKEVLVQATHQALQVLYSIEGTRSIRTNLDTGIPELQLNIDDYSSAELGITRPNITQEVFGQVRGLDAGEYRYSNDPITMRVRSRHGERTQLDRMPALYVYNDQQPVPLQTMASIHADMGESEIHRYNGIPTVTIFSELQPGAAFNQILAKFFKQIEEQPLPAGVNVLIGGEAEGSSNANTAIFKTAPIGLMVMIFFMLLEFNSYRRLLMVMTTIPLAAVGILPGLVLTGSPFGFQSLLGVIALVGIVVNNAIVLLDVVDTQLHAGKSVMQAVQDAIEQRTAPILLTTATTILGLLPLAFSGSTLWPPLAWAVISGLAMSTMLTLIVVPGLCQLLLREQAEAPAHEGVMQS
ncbi:MAG: efflux RND transporter permease subunit, partial [Pseudomonadales bacterium]|nr:efflux RND transporter permease subunit [Pseudomonadales bacterium]